MFRCRRRARGHDSKAVVCDRHGSLSVAENVANAGTLDDGRRVVDHDMHAETPAYAFALSRVQLSNARYAPIRLFHSVNQSTYDAAMATQLDQGPRRCGRRRCRDACTPVRRAIVASDPISLDSHIGQFEPHDGKMFAPQCFQPPLARSRPKTQLPDHTTKDET